MTYVYRSQVAYLDGLTLERDPHGYDLCQRHGARVRVPIGWELFDRRAGLLDRLAG